MTRVRWRPSLLASHPARAVVVAFAVVILAGAMLLSLPIADEERSATGFVTALFTATSAVCVTGPAVVDTGTYWIGFGEGVILRLIQVGGFGIMTMASLLGLLVSGRRRLRMQLTAQAETKSLGIGDVRRVLLGVAEVRGEPDSAVLGRRLAPHVLRQAQTVALLGIGLVIAATLTLLTLTEERLEPVLFEVISAFATVGLSTSITADLPTAGHLLLIGLMFVGRLGSIPLVSALALRERTRRYELPEERPVIG